MGLGREWAPPSSPLVEPGHPRQEELGPPPLLHPFWATVRDVCGGRKAGVSPQLGVGQGPNLEETQEDGTCLRKRKEMGLTQEPSAQTDVELSGMGRSQPGREQEGDERLVGAQTKGPLGGKERN